jgi:hypothetical protein
MELRCHLTTGGWKENLVSPIVPMMVPQSRCVQTQPRTTSHRAHQIGTCLSPRQRR